MWLGNRTPKLLSHLSINGVTLPSECVASPLCITNDGSVAEVISMCDATVLMTSSVTLPVTQSEIIPNFRSVILGGGVPVGLHLCVVSSYTYPVGHTIGVSTGTHLIETTSQ